MDIVFLVIVTVFSAVVFLDAKRNIISDIKELQKCIEHLKDTLEN